MRIGSTEDEQRLEQLIPRTQAAADPSSRIMLIAQVVIPGISSIRVCFDVRFYKRICRESAIREIIITTVATVESVK